jgi:hypothetical protein
MLSVDVQQLELVLYFLVGLIVLTLAGLAAYVVTSNRRARHRLAQTYELESVTARPALPVTGQIMSLLRQEPGGPLQVEIGGRRYLKMGEIEETQLRRQVIDATLELVEFTGALGQGPLEPPALERTQSWREDVRQDSREELGQIRSILAQSGSGPGISPTAPPIASEALEERFLDLLASEDQAASVPERPDLASALRRRRTPKLPAVDQPDTFVDQIDRIVQRRLQLIPALAQRDLHVRLSEDGGVRFVFEGKDYEDLGALPNLTAQQVVRDAIQEWDEIT